MRRIRQLTLFLPTVTFLPQLPAKAQPVVGFTLPRTGPDDAEPPADARRRQIAHNNSIVINTCTEQQTAPLQALDRGRASLRRLRQFACRRRNAGISSWSSSAGFCTGAGRPCGSRPCGRGARGHIPTPAARPCPPAGAAGSGGRSNCGTGCAVRGARRRLGSPRGGRARPTPDAATATCAASRGGPRRSPRCARISFCAGIGSSSIRGMRGVRGARAPAPAG